MEIEIVRKDSRAIEFIVRDTPLPLANIVRRYALAKVPTIAIDEVVVLVNTSALFDEILAHRLAMIPLNSEGLVEKYGDPDICAKCSSEIPEERPSSETCSRCYAHLYLEAEATDHEVMVYSRDLKSEDPDVRPVYDNIPIVLLAPGQKIVLELRARPGRGIEHAKWSPATVSVLRFKASITIDERKCNLCGKCVEICPRGILKIKDRKLVVEDSYNCIICKQCMSVCPNLAIDVRPNEREMILYIESSGSLKPETIVREALNILISELDKLSKKVDEWKLSSEQVSKQ